MTDQVSCPRCNQLVDSQARNCDQCGVDLALAAIEAEQALTFPFQVPITPEVLVPRLGDYFIKNGMLEPDDLQRALQYQQVKMDAGEPCLIGQALVELGFIGRTTLDEAVTKQILQLQTAIQQANRELEQRVRERTAELQGALNKLTELNQLKTNFISNISHELRTPLTHLKGYLDMLADEGLGPLTSQQREALSVLQRAETRLERLIEDLIQFSLAAKGELSINVCSFNPGDLIIISAKHSTNKAGSKRISLQVDLPKQLPKVRADEEKIGWVLMQLLDNAIKFTPAGGSVEIDTQVEDGFVCISITDNGIGIPPEQITDIFEPFHQLDSSVTRRYPGTGLGLAMVRRILEAHGTSIKVQSKVGQGSRFEFSLPIEKDSHA
jgi:signal transduction histidine kinase